MTEQFIALIQAARKFIMRGKPDDTWVTTHLIFRAMDGFMAIAVWLMWVFSFPIRKWSKETMTVEKLSDIPNQPYSVITIIKTLQVRYHSEVEVTVSQRPSFKIGRNVWIFRLSTGVSTNQVVRVTVVS